ncbi:cytochrome P450 [Ideonella sp. 4Y16]|uniref:cytochrome P450 n=1 Tax=Ideonella alba TaxID=2824118 RepID=UPI001B37AFB2|nr:cytochrome P450 [Ideonella alba]MBQ0945720.1 cytochrome P450 [Ideonella alba]
MSATPTTAPPGPACPWWGLPLLRAMYRDYLGFAAGLQREHGDVVALRLGTERSWDLFHPDDVRAALVDHADDLLRWERGTEVFSQAFGQGLLVAEGESWRRQRRMLAPGFLPRRVQGYAALMVDAARSALDAALPPDQDQTVRPVETLFNGLTMDVIMRTLFSSRAPAQAAAAAEATQVLSQAAMQEMFWPASLPDWLPLPHKRAKRRAMRVLTGLVDGQIAQRLALPPDQRPTDDLLAMLLAVRDEDGSGLTATELHDQCMVMFQAGHETSATALLWWSWLMASHPEAAARARQEVDEHLAGRDPTAADGAALPYLAATLKEAMRLYPPVAAVMTRRATRGFELAGRPLPAGTLLRVTPWVIQRDPRWFPEPEAFRPERFLADDPAQPRSAWMPFGVGPRVCIGQHFAMLEMTLVAALLLQRCTLETLPGEPAPQPRMYVTLRPTLPVRLRLQRRGPLRPQSAPCASSVSTPPVSSAA